MPFCSNCGTEVAAGMAACPNCGHPQGSAPYGGAAGYRRTDGQAITAMVLGIVGLVMCPLIPSIFAIVLGNQSKSRIAADPSLDGEGMAKAGVVLGWIGVALGALGIVAVVGVIVLSATTGNFNIDGYP